MQYLLWQNKVKYPFKEVLMLKISTVVPFCVTRDEKASPHITLYLCCSQAYGSL